jgi:hypothetical protein
MLDPPLSDLPAAEPIPTQPIPDSVLEDMKRLLQKFPSIGTHGVKHHIHTGSHPQVFAKSCRLDPENLKIAKAELKCLECVSIVRHSKSPRASPLHMVPKKMDHSNLVAINAVSIW